MFQLRIETDSAAFEDGAGEELARLLRLVADEVQGAGSAAGMGTLRDVNGNTVGRWHYEEAGR